MPALSLQEGFALAAIALTLFAYVPYLRAVLRGGVVLHFFSWLIWSLTTAIVFFAQLAADGGSGAWPTGVSALITFYVTWLAFRQRADVSITRLDYCFLAAALTSLPVWFLTADPLWSVIILTTVDVLGFGPTLRKAWNRPGEESVQFYLLFALRSALSIPALSSRNPTTLLFPLAMMVSSIIVCLLLWWRRRRLD